MKLKEKNGSKKAKRFTISTALYIAAAVVTLIAIASLVDNILLYKNSVSQYVAQGYPVAIVIKQLIPSQLLPAIFDTISVYGGIAFILFSAGIINKKVSECLELLNKDEVSKIAANNNVLTDDSEKEMISDNTESAKQ